MFSADAKIEAALSSEILTCVYKITLSHPEDERSLNNQTVKIPKLVTIL
jgi:hypothetical protein